MDESIKLIEYKRFSSWLEKPSLFDSSANFASLVIHAALNGVSLENYSHKIIQLIPIFFSLEFYLLYDFTENIPCNIGITLGSGRETGFGDLVQGRHIFGLSSKLFPTRTHSPSITTCTACTICPGSLYITLFKMSI